MMNTKKEKYLKLPWKCNSILISIELKMFSLINLVFPFFLNNSTASPSIIPVKIVNKQDSKRYSS